MALQAQMSIAMKGNLACQDLADAEKTMLNKPILLPEGVKQYLVCLLET